MSKIIEFPRQLELPLRWYEVDYDGHFLASVVARPTEDEAIENIRIEAEIYNGSLRTHKITPYQKQIYMLELKSHKACPRYASEDERHKWIAQQKRIGVMEVKSVLKSVDVETFHELLIEEANKTHRELVREVLHEMFATDTSAAA